VSDYWAAVVSLIGLALDSVGGLFLAYDLLGGEHGPLKILARVCIYGVGFVTGFCLLLGPKLGLIVGGGLGVLLAIEYHRAAQDAPVTTESQRSFAVARATVFSAWAWEHTGPSGGLLFIGACSIFLSFLYLKGHASPSDTYRIDRQRGFGLSKIVPSLWRGLVVLGAGLGTQLGVGWSGSGALGFVWLAFSVMVMSACMSALVFVLESTVTRVEDRQIGWIGTVLLLLGFLVQSIQYWLTLLGFGGKAGLGSLR